MLGPTARVMHLGPTSGITPATYQDRPVTTIRNTVSVLDATLAELADRLARATDRATRLEDALERIARGTIPPPSDEAPARAVTTLRRASKRAAWHVGDGATPDQLRAAVEACIRERPRTLREILDETGVSNRNRISGVLVRLQERGIKVENLGTPRRALWFVR